LRTSEESVRLFLDIWPLHILRYGLVLVAVAVWLWQIVTFREPHNIAVLLALALLMEPLLHSPSATRLQTWWASLQTLCAVMAFTCMPGFSTALILASAISGCTAIMSLTWVLSALLITLFYALAFLVISGDFYSFCILIGVYVVSLWVGRLSGLRAQEIQAHQHTVNELEEAQKRLERMADTTRELAAAHERQRLAEEIHDTLGHALVATLLQVQIARKLTETQPAAVDDRLAQVERNIRQALDNVRTALRQGCLNRDRLPLNLALIGLITDFRAAGGPEVELQFAPDEQTFSGINPKIAEVLYRAVQEALTNAVKHGQATLIRVLTEVVGERLYLRIQDNGSGAEHYRPGMGLTGMVRRVQSIGGTLRFQTAVNAGFLIEIGVKLQ